MASAQPKAGVTVNGCPRFGGFSSNGAKWNGETEGNGGETRPDLGASEFLEARGNNEIERRSVRNASVVSRLFLIGCERDLSFKVEAKRNLMNSHRKRLAPL